MRAGWMLVVPMLACGPRVLDGNEGEDATTTGSTSPDPSTTSTSTGMPPPMTTSPPNPTTVATEFTTTDSDSGAESSGAFITEPDFVCSVGPMPGQRSLCFECSIWDQDCERGSKCMPWSNDGGILWNAARCSPVDPSPGQPGDPCTVQGSAVSGVDSCDVATMCWNVDPDTNEGTCVALCGGSENSPVCDGPTTCFIAEESEMPVCTTPCDPLESVCDVGYGCWPDDNGSFGCIPEGSGLIAANQTSPLCALGFMDVDPDAVTGCDPEADLCCTPLCDLDAPACAPEHVCTAFYEAGAAPAGLEDVGICLDP